MILVSSSSSPLALSSLAALPTIAPSLPQVTKLSLWYLIFVLYSNGLWCFTTCSHLFTIISCFIYILRMTFIYFVDKIAVITLALLSISISFVPFVPYLWFFYLLVNLLKMTVITVSLFPILFTLIPLFHPLIYFLSSVLCYPSFAPIHVYQHWACELITAA